MSAQGAYFLRKAENTERDLDSLIRLIRELASYEKMLELALATKELLQQNMFGEAKCAEAVLAYSGTPANEGKAVGMALYFFNFSTFTGKPGLYLEDLYVDADYRKHGIGKALFAFLGKVARERGCPRLDWIVLKWNQPAIDFYKRLGAEEQEVWQMMRLVGEPLAQLEHLK